MKILKRLRDLGRLEDKYRNQRIREAGWASNRYKPSKSISYDIENRLREVLDIEDNYNFIHPLSATSVLARNSIQEISLFAESRRIVEKWEIARVKLYNRQTVRRINEFNAQEEDIAPIVAHFNEQKRKDREQNRINMEDFMAGKFKTTLDTVVDLEAITKAMPKREELEEKEEEKEKEKEEEKEIKND
jgi:hypothetical protein